jgi:hypothetical protein
MYEFAPSEPQSSLEEQSFVKPLEAGIYISEDASKVEQDEDSVQQRVTEL